MRSDPNGGVVLHDWTIDPITGRYNSSERYCELVDAIEQLIRGDAHKLIGGRADLTARLIVSQLAHKHGMVPSDL